MVDVFLYQNRHSLTGSRNNSPSKTKSSSAVKFKPGKKPEAILSKFKASTSPQLIFGG